MKNALEDRLLAFGMRNSIAELDLDKVEKDYSIDLKRPTKKPSNEINLERFDFEKEIKSRAKTMASFYEILYCLEVSTRKLIDDRFSEKYSIDWWEMNNLNGKAIVTDKIKLNVTEIKKNEFEKGFSRSQNNIDYTHFGELSQIIEMNWDVFSDTFENKNALKRINSALGSLRNTIAHCGFLESDDIKRLDSAMSDWFGIKK